MAIATIPGQYYDSLDTFGHFPGGPRGSAVSAGAGIAGKLAYRGAKYVARRFFKPKRYTYIGATGRGIAIGTGIASQFPGEDDPIDGTIQGPNPKKTHRFKQRSRRQRSFHRGGRCNDRHRYRDCC